MINQVDFEGYLTRACEYREQFFMGPANHQASENKVPPRATSPSMKLRVSQTTIFFAP